MEERLIDYFAVVGAGDTINFLNDYAEDGSLLENSHILDAQVLSRYPLADHPDVSFPQMLERFTFPIGIHAEARTGREEPIPTYFVFVSSVKRNIKLYGHCLTFYEELKISQHSMKPSVRNFLKKRLEERQSQSRRGLSTKDIRLFVPKAFVISSRHSFPSFRELLAELYRISCSSVSVPLERYIVHLLSELPMPPLGRSSLQVDFESKTLTFARPPPNTVGNFTAPLHLVFRCLSLENILTVFSALLAERHIILLSSQFSLLTSVGEALLSILFPFKWPFVYIPVLPRGIFTILEAPTPYLVGMHTSLLPEATNLPDDVVMVNLDADNIKVPKLEAWPPKIAGKAGTKLRKALKASAYVGEFGNETARARWRSRELRQLDWAFSFAARPVEMDGIHAGPVMDDDVVPEWRDVREAFLRFFTSLLLNYRRYILLPPLAEAFGDKGNPAAAPPQPRRKLFDTQRYISSHGSDTRPLLNVIVKSQAWHDFLHARVRYLAALAEQTARQQTRLNPMQGQGGHPEGPARAPVRSDNTPELQKQLTIRGRVQSGGSGMLQRSDRLQRAPSLPVLRPILYKETEARSNTQADIPPSTFNPPNPSPIDVDAVATEPGSLSLQSPSSMSEAPEFVGSTAESTEQLGGSPLTAGVERAPEVIEKHAGFIFRGLLATVGRDKLRDSVRTGWCCVDERSWDAVWEWDNQVTEEVEAVLFDECIQAKLNRSKMRWSKLYTPLLDSSEFSNQITVVSIQYDPTYRDSDLLLVQNPVPKLSFTCEDGIAPRYLPRSISSSSPLAHRVVEMQPQEEKQEGKTASRHLPPVCLPARPIASLATLHRMPLRQWRSPAIAGKGTIPPLPAFLSKKLPQSQLWYSKARAAAFGDGEVRGDRNPPIAYGLGYLLNPSLHQEAYSSDSAIPSLMELSTEEDRKFFVDDSFHCIVTAWVSIAAAAYRIRAFSTRDLDHQQTMTLQPSESTEQKAGETAAAAPGLSADVDGAETMEPAAAEEGNQQTSIPSADARPDFTSNAGEEERIPVSWLQLSSRDMAGVAAAVLWRTISAGEALPVHAVRSLALMAGHLCHTQTLAGMEHSPTEDSGISWEVEGPFWRELVEAASDVHESDEEVKEYQSGESVTHEFASSQGLEEPGISNAASISAESKLEEEQKEDPKPQTGTAPEEQEHVKAVNLTAWSSLLQWFKKAYWLGLLPLWEYQLEGLLIGLPQQAVQLSPTEQEEQPDPSSSQQASPSPLTEAEDEMCESEATKDATDQLERAVSGHEYAPPSQPNLHSRGSQETNTSTPQKADKREEPNDSPLPHLAYGMQWADAVRKDTEHAAPPQTPKALLRHIPTAGDGVRLLKPSQTADHEWHIHLPASEGWKMLSDLLPGLRIQPYNGISVPTHGLCALPTAPSGADSNLAGGGGKARATMKAWESGQAARHDVTAEWIPKHISRSFAEHPKRRKRSKSTPKGTQRPPARPSAGSSETISAELPTVAGEHWQKGLVAAAALRRENRLTISSLAEPWVGTRGAGTPLVLDLLPPNVMAKQAEEVGMEAIGELSSKGEGSPETSLPQLHRVWQNKSGLFWNLVWYFEILRLPVQPLLELSGFLKPDALGTAHARASIVSGQRVSATGLPASYPGIKPRRRPLNDRNASTASITRPRAASQDTARGSTAKPAADFAKASSLEGGAPTTNSIEDSHVETGEEAQQVNESKEASQEVEIHHSSIVLTEGTDSEEEGEHTESKSIREKPMDTSKFHDPEETTRSTDWSDLSEIPMPKLRILSSSEELRMPDEVGLEPSP